MTKDLKNNIAIYPTILPVNATANATGVAVALAGYESCVAAITATTASVGGTFSRLNALLLVDLILMLPLLTLSLVELML